MLGLSIAHAEKRVTGLAMPVLFVTEATALVALTGFVMVPTSGGRGVLVGGVVGVGVAPGTTVVGVGVGFVGQVDWSMRNDLVVVPH
jgi:alanine dehydrogenase